MTNVSCATNVPMQSHKPQLHVLAGAVPLRLFAASDSAAVTNQRSGTATARTCEVDIIVMHEDRRITSPGGSI